MGRKSHFATEEALSPYTNGSAKSYYGDPRKSMAAPHPTQWAAQQAWPQQTQWAAQNQWVAPDDHHTRSAIVIVGIVSYAFLALVLPPFWMGGLPFRLGCMTDRLHLTHLFTKVTWRCTLTRCTLDVLGQEAACEHLMGSGAESYAAAMCNGGPSTFNALRMTRYCRANAKEMPFMGRACTEYKSAAMRSLSAASWVGLICIVVSWLSACLILLHLLSEFVFHRQLAIRNVGAKWRRRIAQLSACIAPGGLIFGSTLYQFFVVRIEQEDGFLKLTRLGPMLQKSGLITLPSRAHFFLWVVGLGYIFVAREVVRLLRRREKKRLRRLSIGDPTGTGAAMMHTELAPRMWPSPATAQSHYGPH